MPPLVRDMNDCPVERTEERKRSGKSDELLRGCVVGIQMPKDEGCATTLSYDTIATAQPVPIFPGPT